MDDLVAYLNEKQRNTYGTKMLTLKFIRSSVDHLTNSWIVNSHVKRFTPRNIGCRGLYFDLTQLLDVLVQQCGYTMHLQVASSEFLTTMCLNFQNGPNQTYGPINTKKLYLLNLWENTLVKDNPCKDDFANIHKQYTTLSRNGKWDFANVRVQVSRSGSQVCGNTQASRMYLHLTQYQFDSPEQEAEFAKYRGHVVRISL